MNCGFCGFRLIEGYCWSCCVAYYGNDLTHSGHVGSSWKPIPEGCLLVINRERCTEEIK